MNNPREGQYLFLTGVEHVILREPDCGLYDHVQDRIRMYFKIYDGQFKYDHKTKILYDVPFDEWKRNSCLWLIKEFPIDYSTAEKIFDEISKY